MAPDCVGSKVIEMVNQLQAGEILLLENLRFHIGEEQPEEDPDFVKNLANLGDIYINDAFGSAHRTHASTATVAQFFPGKAAMGLLIEKEIAYLNSALLNPQQPFCAILGGAKISTKFRVIQSLIQKAERLLIGGAMAYTFFKAKGIAMGQSLVEDSFLDIARNLIDAGLRSNCPLLLPVDIVVARELNPHAERRIVIVENEGIPEGFQGLDIGPRTIQIYSQEIIKAKTVFWNGPLGFSNVLPLI